MVVNHIHDLSDLDLFDLLLDRIQAAGKQVILLRVGSVARVEEFLRRGIAYHVDAALVFSDFADAATMREMFRSDHVVMLNGRHDRLSPAVIPDEAVGIEAAVADAAGKGVREVGAAHRPADRRGRAHPHRRLPRELCPPRHFRRCARRRATIPTRAATPPPRRLVGGDPPQALFCTSDAMAMGVLDARRADFPGNRPERFRLYGFDNISLTGFDAYPIASIGYDKARYVRGDRRPADAAAGLLAAA